MSWLLLVSLVWAFSFGLIKGRLAGVDPALVALLRVAFALIVFLPVLRPRAVPLKDALLLAGIGAVQFGLMYVCYNAAFHSLQAYEVAVLTIFTPVLVALFDGLMGGHLRWQVLVAALCAVVGAAVIVVDKPLGAVSWSGILLVQGSNACFALGQVAWRRWRLARACVRDASVFAWLYAGAVAATLPFAWSNLRDVASLSSSHWQTLAYLGLVASGLCFFLWNFGATRTGPGALAVANNAKIPLGVACSIWVFGESGDPVRLIAGSVAIVAAGVLADRGSRRTAT